MRVSAFPSAAAGAVRSAAPRALSEYTDEQFQILMDAALLNVERKDGITSRQDDLQSALEKLSSADNSALSAMRRALFNSFRAATDYASRPLKTLESVMSKANRQRFSTDYSEILNSTDFASVLQEPGPWNRWVGSEADAALSRPAVGESLFEKFLNMTPMTERRMEADGTFSDDSRKLKLELAWARWKTGGNLEDADEDVSLDEAYAALPTSSGSAENDMALLRERYGGELNCYEMVDLIKSMRSMGMISTQENFYIYGTPPVAIEENHFTDKTGTQWAVTLAPDDPEQDESRYHDFMEESPLVSFQTFDDVLDWLTAFRAMEHSERISPEEYKMYQYLNEYAQGERV